MNIAKNKTVSDVTSEKKKCHIAKNACKQNTTAISTSIKITKKFISILIELIYNDKQCCN